VFFASRLTVSDDVRINGLLKSVCGRMIKPMMLLKRSKTNCYEDRRAAIVFALHFEAFARPAELVLRRSHTLQSV